MYICRHIYTYMYIHIHTNTHTHTHISGKPLFLKNIDTYIYIYIYFFMHTYTREFLYDKYQIFHTMGWLRLGSIKF